MLGFFSPENEVGGIKIKVRAMEKEYLENLLLEIDYTSFDKIEKEVQYQHLYINLLNLDKKIKLSCQEAIKYSYSESVEKDYKIDMSEPITDEEFLAHYFIENALFRTLTLWHILAQFYQLYYQLDISKKQVDYKETFKLSLSKEQQFKDKVNYIKKYLDELDQFTGKDWTGNHCFVRCLKDKMAVEDSPVPPIVSEYDSKLKNHPTTLIYRIIEDYSFVSRELKQILTVIESNIREFD